MADAVNFPSENTPEHVAFRLMEKIFNNENKRTGDISREEILATYVQCVKATKGHYLTREQAMM